MANFPALTPLKFVAISILRKLVLRPRNNKYLTVISHIFATHFHAILPEAVKAELSTKSFCCLSGYGLSPAEHFIFGKLLSDPFAGFQHVCNIL